MAVVVAAAAVAVESVIDSQDYYFIEENFSALTDFVGMENC